jgi:hypothetical protein
MLTHGLSIRSPLGRGLEPGVRYMIAPLDRPDAFA